MVTDTISTDEHFPDQQEMATMQAFLDFFQTNSAAIVAIAETFMALATLAAAYFASRGINEWRAKLSGTSNYEAARKLLTSSYSLSNAVASYRSPFGSGEPEALQFERRREIVEKHLQPFRDAAVDARALWGDAVKPQTDEIFESVNKLYAETNAYLHLRALERDLTAKEMDRFRQAEEIVYGTGGPSDEFAKKLAREIENLEECLRPKLSLKGF